MSASSFDIIEYDLSGTIKNFMYPDFFDMPSKSMRLSEILDVKRSNAFFRLRELIVR